MDEIIFIGRFQPFHLGHLDAINQIIKKSKKNKLIVMIGSSNIKRTQKNPFSYTERKKILKKILDNEKINYEILKLDDYKKDITWINKLNKYKNNLFYSSNNEVVNLLKENKFKVKKVNFNIKISAMEIRELIKKNNLKWKKYVPEKIHNDIISLKKYIV